MTQIEFLDWTFLVDKKLTADIYSTIDKGGADRCACSFCKNYVAKRPKLFESQLIHLFKNLSIDIAKEYEVCYLGRQSNGLHLYSTWFNLAGQILDGPDCKIQLPSGASTVEHYDLTSNLSVAFFQTSKPADSFFDQVESVVQIEFILTIPWTIDDDEPQ